MDNGQTKDRKYFISILFIYQGSQSKNDVKIARHYKDYGHDCVMNLLCVNKKFMLLPHVASIVLLLELLNSLTGAKPNFFYFFYI